MEALTLYVIYVAIAGGPEKRIIRHLYDEKECREVLTRWKAESLGKYTIKESSCLTADEYNAKVGVITTDRLSDDRRL